MTTKHMTREEYLKSLSEWRAKYPVLSKNILQHKLDIKAAMRRLIESGAEQHQLFLLRCEARDMMAARVVMKQQAIAAYQTQKEQRNAAMEKDRGQLVA